MANQYTSIATTPGLATELVQPSYDLAVRYALKGIPSARQFVSVRPQQPAMHGSSISIEKINYFTNATIAGFKTPLSEEVDVDSTKVPQPGKVTITPNEYGAAITSTRKLGNRTFAAVDPIKANLIAHAMSRTIDELVQDALVSGTPLYTGTNVADSTLTDAMPLTANDVRKHVAVLRAGNVMPWFGGFFAAYAHPFVILDLRTETGAGSWRVGHEYGVSQAELWTGEIGEFEGCRFINSNLTRVTATGATGANVFNTYILGQGGLAESVVEEPHVEFAPPVDKLNRFAGLGWYGDLGWALYEPLAVKDVRSGSSLGASYVASA